MSAHPFVVIKERDGATLKKCATFQQAEAHALGHARKTGNPCRISYFGPYFAEGSDAYLPNGTLAYVRGHETLGAVCYLEPNGCLFA